MRLLLLLLLVPSAAVDATCLMLWDPGLCHLGNLTLFSKTEDG